MKQCRTDCIHAEACIRYADNSTYWQNGDCPIYKPTADVVPKSEVEKIFDEIEKALSNAEYRAKTPRKTVKVEELTEQANWILHEAVPNILAPLKKKYTESEDKG